MEEMKTAREPKPGFINNVYNLLISIEGNLDYNIVKIDTIASLVGKNDVSEVDDTPCNISTIKAEAILDKLTSINDKLVNSNKHLDDINTDMFGE